MSGFAAASTETLLEVQANLLRGLDLVAAHAAAGTLHTIGPNGRASPAQAGHLTLALLYGVDAELAARQPRKDMRMTGLTPAAEAVLTLIKSRGGVSFVEIAQALRAAGVDVDGQLTMHHGDPDNNLVVWVNVSEQFIAVVNELLGAKLVHYRAADPLVYVADGGAVNLPIARHKTSYKRPRWLPVVFNPGPVPDEKG